MGEFLFACGHPLCYFFSFLTQQANALPRKRFTWKKHLKGYYSNIHELPENVKDRIKYILFYFKELEPRLPLFILISEKIEKELIEGNINAAGVIEKGKGKKLNPSACRRRIVQDMGAGDVYHVAEYHIDDHPVFPSWSRWGPAIAPHDAKHENFLGGFYSNALPDHVVKAIDLGQDESVLGQNNENEFAWFGTNGEFVMRPKNDGTGGHMSGFTSGAIGWRPHLSEAVIEEVRKNREGKQYFSKDDALGAFGSIEKDRQIINNENNPFYRTMIVGAHNDGYWNASHFVGQLEDLGDVLPVLMKEKFPNLKFEYYLAIDHSQGHTKKREDGLDPNMRVGWQYERKDCDIRPRDTIIPDRVGPHRCKDFHLEPGMRQRLWFDPDDPSLVGPFDLTPNQRENQKLDQVCDESRPKKKTRAMLKQEITNYLNNSTHIRNRTDMIRRVQSKRLAALQADAKKYGIPTVYTRQKKKYGWLGKDKGSRQVLAERGWVDPKNPKEMTKEGELLHNPFVAIIFCSK